MPLYPRALPTGLFDVRSYGAKGDGIADDQPAVQAAIDAAGAAGGGTVFFPPGIYLLTAQKLAGWYHLVIAKSRITLLGAGRSSVIRVTDAYAVACVGDPTWDIYAATVYPMASAAIQAMSVTLSTPAAAANFAPGDYCFIRTGQTLEGMTGQPDAEINRIATADAGTGVLTLAWPTTKPYAQEYFIAGTNGMTSTSVTANPALFGVANVNALVISDLAIRSLHFDDPGLNHALQGGSVVGLTVADCSGTFLGGFQSMGNYRFAKVSGCVFHHTGTVVNYTLSTATGTSDVIWQDNILTGSRIAQLHIREGSARVQVIGNLLAMGSSALDQNLIAVGPRGYDISIIGNTIAGTSGGVAVNVGGAPGGGIISGNTVLSAGGSSIFVDTASPNWVVSGNLTPNAPVVAPAPLEGALVGYLSGWVKAAAQTVIIGTLPPGTPTYVLPPIIQVWEAFNSDGTDLITIGSSASADMYGAATDVSTTGIKAVGAGSWAGIGYDDATGRVVTAYYVNGGTEPTTGKALVLVPFIRVPARP